MGEVSKKLTFQDKMHERIKNSIGDLISDEDLSKMVHRAIEESFFKQYEVGRTPQRYGQDVVEYAPPLLESIVRDCMQSWIKNHVDKWMVENSDKIHQVLRETVEGGAEAVVRRGLEKVVGEVFRPTDIALSNQIQMLIRRMDDNGVHQ